MPPDQEVPVLDHLSLPVRDPDASARFYLQVFAPLGLSEMMRFPRDGGSVVAIGGTDGQPRFWLGPGGPATPPELHVALAAPDRAAVDAVHEAARAAGTEVLHAPRLWPEYHPAYYAVFLRDPDGHNVEAVCHRP
ncbi:MULTISPECIES: VOC family protein [unclassified Pseudonocardia]|uniref:VOC family protein n=1 Tax=unclassified Pseudonocardia TaxID=2619320 RepID=UPI001D036065|nr:MULTISPECIES: VOC family protein [unclassified Pseudonocardia]